LRGGCAPGHFGRGEAIRSYEDGTARPRNFANETAKRGALGLIVALGFEGGVREDVEALGVKALDRHDLQRIAGLWDPLKQRTAVQSFVYYAQHVEKNSTLTARVMDFLGSAE